MGAAEFAAGELVLCSEDILEIRLSCALCAEPLICGKDGFDKGDGCTVGSGGTTLASSVAGVSGLATIGLGKSVASLGFHREWPFERHLYLQTVLGVCEDILDIRLSLTAATRPRLFLDHVQIFVLDRRLAYRHGDLFCVFQLEQIYEQKRHLKNSQSRFLSKRKEDQTRTDDRRYRFGRPSSNRYISKSDVSEKRIRADI